MLALALLLIQATHTYPEERPRIVAHLHNVERELRSASVDHLDVGQRAHRAALLDVLARYRSDAVFPHNHARPFERVPVFIDDHGTACAVGHLMIASGARDVAEDIARDDVFIRVHDIRDARVLQWAEQHGFTVEELARIQPSYGPSAQELLCAPSKSKSKGELQAAVGQLLAGTLRDGFGQVGRRNYGMGPDGKPLVDKWTREKASPLLRIALVCAATEGWIEGAKLLLAEGAPLDVPDDDGRTVHLSPLAAAVERNQLEMARLLIEKKAPLVTTGALTPLALARDDAVFDELLRVGADPSTGWSAALIEGKPKQNARRIAVLLERGAKVDAVARCDHKNVYDEQSWVCPGAAALQSAFPPPTSSSTQDWDAIRAQERPYLPIHRAAAIGDVEAVRTLLARGASATAPTSYDVTPLHLAAVAGSTAVVEALLAKGADACAKTTRGFTPFDLTALVGTKPRAVLELLRGRQGCTEHPTLRKELTKLKESSDSWLRILERHADRDYGDNRDNEGEGTKESRAQRLEEARRHAAARADTIAYLEKTAGPTLPYAGAGPSSEGPSCDAGVGALSCDIASTALFVLLALRAITPRRRSACVRAPSRPCRRE